MRSRAGAGPGERHRPMERVSIYPGRRPLGPRDARFALRSAPHPRKPHTRRPGGVDWQGPDGSRAIRALSGDLKVRMPRVGNIVKDLGRLSQDSVSCYSPESERPRVQEPAPSSPEMGIGVTSRCMHWDCADAIGGLGKRAWTSQSHVYREPMGLAVGWKRCNGGMGFAPLLAGQGWLPANEEYRNGWA